jgi:hypothetical protein
MKNLQVLIRQRKADMILTKLLMALPLEGFSFDIRPALWMNLLGAYDSLKVLQDVVQNAIQKSAFDGFESDSTNTVTSLYIQLKQLSVGLLTTTHQSVDDYLTLYKTRKGFLNDGQLIQCQELLHTFMYFQQSLGITLNPHMYKHLFLLAVRVQSFSQYHFIHVGQRIQIFIDSSPGKATLNDKQSLSFFLLHAFLNSVLADYPLLQDQSHRVLLEDCSFVNCYLTRYHREMFAFMKIYNIKMETLLFECYINMFSDLFVSEALYRIWDVIIMDYVMTQVYI